MKNNSIGGSFDDFIAGESLAEAVETSAIKKDILTKIENHYNIGL